MRSKKIIATILTATIFTTIFAAIFTKNGIYFVRKVEFLKFYLTIRSLTGISIHVCSFGYAGEARNSGRYF